MNQYTKPTLADLKQSLADRLTSGIIPAKSATLTLWTRSLNRGVSYCVRKLKRTKAIQLTTVNGTVSLPDDFNTIDRIFDSAKNEWQQIGPMEATSVDGEQVFWINGDLANGFALNTPSDDTFTVHYTYQPQEMALDGDICPFEDEEAPVAYAYGMIRKSQSDPFGDAQAALSECDARIKEIESQQNTNDNYSGFSLPQGA